MNTNPDDDDDDDDDDDNDDVFDYWILQPPVHFNKL